MTNIAHEVAIKGTVALADPETGTTANVNDDGQLLIYTLTDLPVRQVHKNYDIVSNYMCSDIANTTMTSTLAVDGRSFTVASATGIAPFQCVKISQGGYLLQALILTVVGTTITINAPSDKVFTSGALIQTGSFNMNVDGSVTSQVFFSGPPAGAIWHISRITIGLADNAAMDSSLYGGLPALANGVVLRRRDGTYRNIFIVNDNGGFAERCGATETEYTDKAPSGFYGFTATLHFSGDGGLGTYLTLDGTSGDRIEFIIQDNLTGLTKMSALVSGHKTTEDDT